MTRSTEIRFEAASCCKRHARIVYGDDSFTTLSQEDANAHLDDLWQEGNADWTEICAAREEIRRSELPLECDEKAVQYIATTLLHLGWDTELARDDGHMFCIRSEAVLIEVIHEYFHLPSGSSNWSLQ